MSALSGLSAHQNWTEQQNTCSPTAPYWFSPAGYTFTFLLRILQGNSYREDCGYSFHYCFWIVTAKHVDLGIYVFSASCALPLSVCQPLCCIPHGCSSNSLSGHRAGHTAEQRSLWEKQGVYCKKRKESHMKGEKNGSFASKGSSCAARQKHL